MTLTVIPEALTAAAADVTRIGTSLSEAHALAAPATTSIAPAAAVGQDVISIQAGPSVNVSSSIPFDLLAGLTNTGIPVIGPALDGLAIELAAS
jgi:hypothetical protein